MSELSSEMSIKLSEQYSSPSAQSDSPIYNPLNHKWRSLNNINYDAPKTTTFSTCTLEFHIVLNIYGTYSFSLVYSKMPKVYQMIIDFFLFFNTIQIWHHFDRYRENVSFLLKTTSISL